MTKAQICPICNGRQRVPEGLYFSGASSRNGEVQCKSCGGLGYILIDEVSHYV